MSRLSDELHRLNGLGKLGDIPLVVISRGRRDAQGVQAQQRLAALSTKSAFIVAENSGHNVMFDDPARFAEGVGLVLKMRSE
jgi:pimeloyl-ACP methyl ester carboxylesterase